MGCDVRFYVERNVNDTWEPVKGPNPYYGRYADEPEETLADWAYDNQNYNLFAILANVRNGRGFAGRDTGNGFIPIAMPKGLPDDVSPEINKKSEQYGCDGHSHSYFTLQELLDYDWTQTTKLRGYVGAITYYKWCSWDKGKGESPNEWCGDVGGGLAQKISEQEMSRKIEEVATKELSRHEAIKAIDAKLPHTYCLVEWEQPYYKTCRGFWSDTIPKLLRLGKPGEVRIVFWFDN